MIGKIDNLKELEIWSDIELLSRKIKESTNTDEKMANSIVRLTFYFQETLNNNKLLKKSLSDYRNDRNRAIERARKAEKKIDLLEGELKKFKKLF
jgi:adenylosuccinate synthase